MINIIKHYQIQKKHKNYWKNIKHQLKNKINMHKNTNNITILRIYFNKQINVQMHYQIKKPMNKLIK